ncbi:MAG: cation:proton antiporter [Deltaproteobacteria bacterium]|nr:cation:proton antiporter [Deltaproteobacteria bacterium]MBN2671980.1 cation:proton antiporter [Deltaproteobacteria bacterium]
MHDTVLTLSLSAAMGVVLVVAAKKFMIPAIVLLLGGGILLGPEVLALVHPESLGNGLETIAALTISVILFEGGLTLDFEGYRKSSAVIRRMLTIGPLITWFGVSATVYFLYHTDPVMALMVASMVIVTGPTVVLPILRRLKVKERLHHVLYWEGVLIDVVGVFVAVLCYEWITNRGELPLMNALGNFGMRMLIGFAMGTATGLLIALSLRREWVEEEHVNIFVLAGALFTFGVAHAILPESGILAVVISGLVVALRKPPRLKQLKRFKLQLTEVGIGTIFVLLSAKLELDRFNDVRLLLLLVVIVFVLRPLVVWISTWGQKFDWREKTFLSWIAPRGIVAASMASLFSLRLSELGYKHAELIETVTYAAVIATVTVQGLSAPWLAKLLGVQRKDRRTWVLLGDSPLIKALGSALRKGGVKTVEVDGVAGNTNFIDPDEPRFNDVHAVFFADITMLSNVWTAFNWGFHVNATAYYRWATFENEKSKHIKLENVPKQCESVWATTVTSAIVSAGIQAGHQSIELVEIGSNLERGRFGKEQLPLFWINEGRATIIHDPMNPGEPAGNMAIVLRQRELGLSRILSHVEVMDEGAVPFEVAVKRLAVSAHRQFPSLPQEEVVAGIFDRTQTMPVAVGGAVAIPHAYWDGVDRSVCYLGVVPDGVSDMAAPDELPVKLVFLLLSPTGKATEHLESLAAISHLTQEPEFIDLICRQRVPARILSLITERG